ncbi:hypothetical protein SNEBB_007179 [Seison nebaliae]|nr:hypothetical protein SNEBB_007179 [Seison nebaliae]
MNNLIIHQFHQLLNISSIHYVILVQTQPSFTYQFGKDILATLKNCPSIHLIHINYYSTNRQRIVLLHHLNKIYNLHLSTLERLSENILTLSHFLSIRTILLSFDVDGIDELFNNWKLAFSIPPIIIIDDRSILSIHPKHHLNRIFITQNGNVFNELFAILFHIDNDDGNLIFPNLDICHNFCQFKSEQINRIMFDGLIYESLLSFLFYSKNGNFEKITRIISNSSIAYNMYQLLETQFQSTEISEKKFCSEFQNCEKYSIIPSISRRWNDEVDQDLEKVIHEEKLFRISLMLGPPFCIWKGERDLVTNQSLIVDSTTSHLADGFMYQIARLLVENLNHPSQITILPYRTYPGDENESGNKLIGTINRVLEEEIDLFCPITYTKSRGKYIPFVYSLMSESISILVYIHSNSKDIFHILQGINSNLWICSILILLFLSALFFLVLLVEYNIRNHQRIYLSPEVKELIGKSINDPPIRRKCKLCLNFLLTKITFQVKYSQQFLVKRDIFSFFASNFCTANYGMKPDYIAGRMVLLFWWIFCLIFTISYTANLTSLFTLHNVEPPIKSMKDLAKNKQYTPISFEGSSVKNIFKAFHSKMYDELLDRMEYCNDTETILNRVRYKKRVLISDHHHIQELALEYCEFYEIFENVAPLELGCAINPSLKFRPLINKIFLKIDESGLSRLYRRKYLDKNPKKYKCVSYDERIIWNTAVNNLKNTNFRKRHKNQGPIKFPQISGIFAIWLIGICLTLIVLLVEIFIFRYQNKKKLIVENKNI